MTKTVEPTFQRVDDRGVLTEVLNDGTWATVLHGRMKRGAILGNHYHRQTVTFLFIITGCAEVATVEVAGGRRERLTVSAGQGAWLQPNVSHAIRFLEDSECLILKSIRYDPDHPDTVAYPVDAQT